jgi:hypothetical protein
MPNTITFRDATFILALILFGLGAVCIIAGLVVLLSRAMGREMIEIARQSKAMVSKGLAEELAALVGNATALLSALDSLVRTSAGIGIFLMTTGCALMYAGWEVYNQIDWY